MFAGKIRIEGNTDNVGSYNNNVKLSEKRAKAVADFLVLDMGVDLNRLVIVGNGPDKPVHQMIMKLEDLRIDEQILNYLNTRV